mgnify:CR=1 FL=1
MPTKVKFIASGVEAEWSEGRLLDFAESVGLIPDYGCRGGSCGSCETRLISGEVSYLDEPLYEPEPGNVLLCCSCPAAGTEILELDV